MNYKRFRYLRMTRSYDLVGWMCPELYKSFWHYILNSVYVNFAIGLKPGSTGLQAGYLAFLLGGYNYPLKIWFHGTFHPGFTCFKGLSWLLGVWSASLGECWRVQAFLAPNSCAVLTMKWPCAAFWLGGRSDIYILKKRNVIASLVL